MQKDLPFLSLNFILPTGIHIPKQMLIVFWRAGTFFFACISDVVDSSWNSYSTVICYLKSQTTKSAYGD